MERDFYTDEFEDLIKLKADQFRMYPSDKVWKGVNRSLHSSKRKYWFGFALLLTGLSYLGIDQLIVSPPAKQIANPKPGNPVSENKGAKVIPFDQLITGSLNSGHPIQSSSEKQQDLSPSADEITKNLPGFEQSITPDSDVSILIDKPILGMPYASKQEASAKQPNIVSIEKSSNPSIYPIITTSQLDLQGEEDIQKLNWLQEFAVYDLITTKPKRLTWQLSFAPTMNYRRLTGSKNAHIQSNSRNIPIALSIEGDLDRLVNHKPALGFELGSYLLYNVTHNFSFKAGLQFNYSRYEIQAYSSGTERATIALNSINGLNSPSISNLTQLRNFGGYAVQNLQNQYFQVSVPLGIEVTVLGNNKLQLGVSGTLQPTYLLNRNTYLISSDYKNYTREPSLVRRWNINTSAETFVSYKTAGLKWQVGPQIRYQLLSSYTDKYPIKEYLIEYGVKIGVTKTIR